MRSLRTKLYEAICSVLPVAALVLAVSFTPLAPLSWRERAVFALSALFLSLGIGLFPSRGADPRHQSERGGERVLSFDGFCER